LFDTSLGRIGDKLYGDEEIRVLKKLIDNGEKVFYCPEVIVHHRIPANRLKKRYFRKWFFDAGELSGLLMGEYLKRNFKGIPLYTIKSFLWKAAFYLKCEVFGRQDRFLEQLKLLNQLGFMSGRMKYKKMNKTDV
jgi:hypothetical protein